MRTGPTLACRLQFGWVHQIGPGLTIDSRAARGCSSDAAAAHRRTHLERTCPTRNHNPPARRRISGRRRSRHVQAPRKNACIHISPELSREIEHVLLRTARVRYARGNTRRFRLGFLLGCLCRPRLSGTIGLGGRTQGRNLGAGHQSDQSNPMIPQRPNSLRAQADLATAGGGCSCRLAQTCVLLRVLSVHFHHPFQTLPRRLIKPKARRHLLRDSRVVRNPHANQVCEPEYRQPRNFCDRGIILPDNCIFYQTRTHTSSAVWSLRSPSEELAGRESSSLKVAHRGWKPRNSQENVPGAAPSVSAIARTPFLSGTNPLSDNRQLSKAENRNYTKRISLPLSRLDNSVFAPRRIRVSRRSV